MNNIYLFYIALRDMIKTFIYYILRVCPFGMEFHYRVKLLIHFILAPTLFIDTVSVNFV